MKRLHIAPIVEGHGEVPALPVLLRRIALELGSELHIEVERPWRVSRTKIIRHSPASGSEPTLHLAELQHAVKISEMRLAARSDPADCAFVLVVLDAEGDCPKFLAPKLIEGIQRAQVSIVVANICFETWFAAGASSLSPYLDLGQDGLPANPEESRIGKKWVEDRIRQPKYSEVVDQPRLTARMDLRECRSKSPSFDKLCRVIETRLTERPPA